MVEGLGCVSERVCVQDCMHCRGNGEVVHGGECKGVRAHVGGCVCFEDVRCPLELTGRGACHCMVPNLGRRTLMVCVCLWLAGQGPMDMRWMGTNELADVCPSGACWN